MMATMEEMQKEVAELAEEMERLQQQYAAYQRRGAAVEAAKAEEVRIPTPNPAPTAVPSPAATAIVPSATIEGIRAGKQYYIKSTLPLLDLLPGLPYIQGIPILPGFKISETP